MQKRLQSVLHICLTLVFILSLVLVQPGLAASSPQQRKPQPQSDDIRYGYNTETGRLSFVGGNLDKPLISSGEVGAQTVDAAAMSVIRRYAGQFGLQDPARNLRLQRTQQEGDGATLRYQQQYRGVPVVGGEMIINTDAAGNVLSLNGEVSPDLALSSVTPVVSAEQARQAALQGMQEWHGIQLDPTEITEPELWIYDEWLLKKSDRPAALVWRMEAGRADFSVPVNEFILVDALTGQIALHFNQVAMGLKYQEEPTPEPTEEITPEPEPTASPTPVPTPAEIVEPDPLEQINQQELLLAGGTIIFIEGNYQETYFHTAFTKTMKVLVKDTSSNPIVGVSVQFEAPASGASGTFPGGSNQYTAETDANGIATSAVFTANGTMGSYQVTATAAEHSLYTVFLLTNMGPEKFVDSKNGSDDNSFGRKCGEFSYPCKSIQPAINKAKAGDLIKIASGNYQQQEVIISKDLTLSGGWNSSFEAQIGNSSLIDPSSRQMVTVYSGVSASMNRINITGGYKGIDNEGTLDFRRGHITKTKQAIHNRGSLTVVNATISRNSCYNSNCQNSAGILNDGGAASLTNVTIVENFLYHAESSIYQPETGGLFNKSGTITLQNTIVSQNHSNTGFDCHGVITSSGNNFIGNNHNCTFTKQTGDIVGSRQKPVNPHYLPLSDNGGDTLTVPLMPSSPAVNAGSSTVCPQVDQRGSTRATGSNCNMGAYEGVQTGEPAGYAVTFSTDDFGRLPGWYPKCETPQTNCTNGADPETDFLHTLALDIYKFFLNSHKRNSLDDAGKPVVSTSKYPVQNAFWNGSQMVFGKGFVVDDIVAHEFAHGITQYTSNLFYYYQSGAINESLSDLWGEYYDQTNSFGKDTSSVRWLIGEDLPASIGVLRNMQNPPAFKDPDKMTSPYYYLGAADNGGIHWNSGVNNKAIFLMVDGGTFNNRTVKGIGWKKTAAVYYYAQTRLLSSASDYADLYYALNHACLVLVGGSEGITTEDCKQVQAATNAVEMTVFPIPGFDPDVAYCTNGLVKSPTDLFLDDFENGSSKWLFKAAVGIADWSIVPGKYDIIYATSGDYALFGNNADSYQDGVRSDTRAEMASGITVPSNSVTMLHFNHSFGFEWGYDPGYNLFYFIDGGVLEYSVDNGGWKDAKALFSGGLDYNGTIFNANYYGFNPLRNRAGFVADSHGYVSSRYELSSLAGKSVRFRWRMGTDAEDPSSGWFIDDVRIYTCVGAPGRPGLSSPANGNLITNYQPKLDWKDSANTTRYELQVASDADFTNMVFQHANLEISEYKLTTPLTANTRFYWRVRAFNAIDAASAWSSTWSFRTALVPPVLELPEKDSIPDNLRPVFTWTTSPGAESYTLILSTSADFSSPLIDLTGTETSYTPITNLPANTPMYWRVRANGSNTSAWAASSFITPNPPSRPTLSSPANNGLVHNYKPTLTWLASTVPAGALALAYYHLQFDDDADFSSPLLDKADLIDRSITLPDQLAPNQKYYWRVKAVNTAGQYSTWATRSLRTGMVPPDLLSPESGFVVDNLRPTFTWSTSNGASAYRLVVSTNADYSLPLIDASLAVTTYTPTFDLPSGALLYWRVRAEGTNPSAWATSSFMIPVPPSRPVLAAPSNSGLVSTYTPRLRWNASVIPDGAPELAFYQLQLDDDSDFSSPIYDETGLVTISFDIPIPLPANSTFYWRVRAVNVLGQSSSWSRRTLRTRLVSPEIVTPPQASLQDSLRPVFEWSSSPGASSYTLVISTFSNFSSPLINATVTNTVYTPAASFTPGTVIYWRVMANGINPSLWTAGSFTSPNPPVQPALTAPAAKARTAGYTPTLTWRDAAIPAGALPLDHYYIQIDNDADFSSPLYDQPVGLNTSFTIPSPLEANRTYHWRVKAVNTAGHFANWSKRMFRTRIYPPTLEFPEPDTIVEHLRPELRWNSSPEATTYTLEISTSTDFTLPLVSMTQSGTRYSPAANLPVNTRIYWRVKANGSNPSLWVSSSFITPNPPGRPALSAPSNKGLLSRYDPILKWNASVVPVGAPALAYYNVQVDDDADFSSPLYDEQIVNATSFAILDPLPENGKFYWRVRAVNTDGQYASWSSRTFRTRIYAPTIVAPGEGAVSDSLRPNFQWSSSPYATSYTLVVSKFADFSSPLVQVTSSENNFTPAANLPAAAQLHWRVMANGDNASLWASSSFTTPNPPSIPLIISPKTERIHIYTPTFRWDPVTIPAGSPAFASFHIQVANDAAFSSLLYDVTGLTDTQFVIPDELPENQRFFWRVRALNIEGQFAWWRSTSFRTVVRTPELLSPEPNALLTSTKPTFEWTDVNAASSYTIVISLFPDLSSPVVQASVRESQYAVTVSLLKGKTYYWRVRANGVHGSSRWTETRQFQIST
jgi:Zn-dependent metalloprotease